MRKLVLVVALMLGFALTCAPARAATSEGFEKAPPGRTDMKDKSQEDDCDCCQKCKAARKPVRPEEEEGLEQKNGCEDCCNRCGRTLPSAPQESPPDIIDKPER